MKRIHDIEVPGSRRVIAQTDSGLAARWIEDLPAAPPPPNRGSLEADGSSRENERKDTGGAAGINSREGAP